MKIRIENAQIFDGNQLIPEHSITFDEQTGNILSLGSEEVPVEKTLDAGKRFLMPGLIDSHVHTDMAGLSDALKFGVTTELEMNGRWTTKQRQEIKARRDIADLRSPGMGVTARGGHPSEYAKSSGSILIRLLYPLMAPMMSVKDPQAARKFVRKQVKNGADYIKIFLEEGTPVGFPGLPVIDDATLKAAIDEAHRLGKLTFVHATRLKDAHRAVDAGIDALAHLFFDQIPDDNLLEKMRQRQVFIIPTAVTLSTAFGYDARWLAEDPRVKNKLSKVWLDSLSRSMNVYPSGKMADVYLALKKIAEAGIPILAGSDVSEPIPILGGLAHGVSLHQELQIFEQAGLERLSILKSATSRPAHYFRLADRGTLEIGKRADFILIDGNPLENISESLNVSQVFRQGKALNIGMTK